MEEGEIQIVDELPSSSTSSTIMATFASSSASTSPAALAAAATAAVAVYLPRPKRHLQHLSSALSRYHAGFFRISLALCGQALLWKTLTNPPKTEASTLPLLPNLPSVAFLLLWCLSLAVLAALCLLYVLRCALHFSSARAEFAHHVGVNYLFTPFISSLLLLQSSPFDSSHSQSHKFLWLAFAIPILALDVKIYGQWFTTNGKRFLSVVANPTSQMTVIGNLVGARAAAATGWSESAVCMFSLGMAHYLVLFVTLYQRHQGSDSLPAMLRPVFFLFFAAPSAASLAWDAIAGTFDFPCRMLFFLSLFLFASLISRPALFKRSMRRFSVAWWAYSFPLTILAQAATEYAHEVHGVITKVLMLALSILSVLVTLVLMFFTIVNPNRLLPQDDPFAVSINQTTDAANANNSNAAAGDLVGRRSN